MFHYSRKHPFVLHHAKFHRNSPKNHKAVYSLGTLNIPLILFSIITPENVFWSNQESC